MNVLNMISVHKILCPCCWRWRL